MCPLYIPENDFGVGAQKLKFPTSVKFKMASKMAAQTTFAHALRIKSLSSTVSISDSIDVSLTTREAVGESWAPSQEDAFLHGPSERPLRPGSNFDEYENTTGDGIRSTLKTRVPSSAQYGRETDTHRNGSRPSGEKRTRQEGQVIDIAVTSSKEQVLVTVGSAVVLNVTSFGQNATEEMKSAGLYFVVLSQYDGRVLIKRRFDLYQYATGLSFPPLVTSIAKGRIMVFAVKTEASLNMPKVIRNILEDLGATFGQHLSFRRYWAWVVMAGGGQTLGEITTDEVGIANLFSSPISLFVEFSLERVHCYDTSDPREKLRSRFCRLYGGYGSLCDCEDPAPLVYEAQELENSAITEIPLGIVASKRPQALYRCLVTILSQRGGSVERTIVLIDGHNQEIMDLLDLLGIQYRINDMEGTVFPGLGARISEHYKFSLNAIFSTFQRAQKAIVLEEDVLAAPDFFSYFNQTAWLLDVDASIYCISAWNDLGALHIANHPSKLYRVETHAGYGWMLTRQFFQEVYPIWKSTKEEHDWDMWFRSTEIRAGRECVVPDVSRTFHYSSSGAHIQNILTQAHFAGHAVTSSPDIRLHNVDRMTQEKYEEDIYAVLEGEDVYYLNTTLHPCMQAFMPKNFTLGPVVIFMMMDNIGTFEGWKKLGSCLGAWQLDVRAHHRGLVRMNFYNTQLLIIGYPFSDYSYLKPSWVGVSSEIGNQESLLGRRTLLNRIRFPRPELEEFSPFLLKQLPTAAPAFADFFIPYLEPSEEKGKG
ncbi:protein O-linked-mannose beta-1,2-N-acetylglucosaminyltransferase 1-like [Macrobrachium nipponense]|uniref:protein O-linked-mannose beta-1,2-N-acetylglucosaminyltransferase 1-like n=1 Tax=Macrobrachium nipponense TaxID=159736 RepID=UPI0030C82942